MKRDLRKYSTQTNRQLVIGALLILFLVGGGLIWYFYGGAGAGLGVVCLLAGLTPVVLILGIFFVMDWILKRAGRK
jgi:sterol desaturase/sphingolipid hydroxylase (fatty acid hydroxylase superfamily)